MPLFFDRHSPEPVEHNFEVSCLLDCCRVQQFPRVDVARRTVRCVGCVPAYLRCIHTMIRALRVSIVFPYSGVDGLIIYYLTVVSQRYSHRFSWLQESGVWSLDST